MVVFVVGAVGSLQAPVEDMLLPEQSVEEVFLVGALVEEVPGVVMEEVMEEA